MISKQAWQSVFPQSGKSVNSLQDSIRKTDLAVVYPQSVQVVNGNLFFMVREQDEKRLVVVADDQVAKTFAGATETINEYQLKVCTLNDANLHALQAILPWMVPQAIGTQQASIGLGDRLGLAGPGHIATVRNRAIMPILAQQSIRELDLTGRNYPMVLAAAAWAVFQEGYSSGYGADGDHLKDPKDVKMSVELGFSMITLDCSEHIDDSVASLSNTEASTKYQQLAPELRGHFESTYLNKQFELSSGTTISFSEQAFEKMVLVYVSALDFAEKIHQEYITTAGREIDFEVSIDEVTTPTTPQDHFFVANELQLRGIKANSIAPRFCGEFQKGIDYIGDINQFEQEFMIHAEIADHFGYKVSIHSGSDKFGVFGIIGRYTKGRFHVKTAGTNWLEAVRVIAVVNPSLYREMHIFALDNLDEAKKYYHVTFKLSDIPQLDTLSDSQLPELMNQNAARQLIHITYGLLLQAQDDQGQYLFRDRFYQELHNNEATYSERLQTHIGKHLDLLHVEKQ